MGNPREHQDSAKDPEEEVYAKGWFFDGAWLQEHAVPVESGAHPTRKIVVDLNQGDSVAVLSSGKGKRIWGPNSVETVYWSSGSVSQTIYDLGKAPAIKPYVPRSVKQSASSTDTQTFEWNGERKTAAQWYSHSDRHVSVSKMAFRNRLKVLGWDVHRSLTTPVKASAAAAKHKSKPGIWTFEWNGERKTAQEWYEHPDRHPSVSKETFSARLKNLGWDVHRALTTPSGNKYQA
ncbi:hypothetical protein [Streptomyces atratus]|uniref:hypothetical protein n=1 Tax=Streptomyces atratus TaxID=1893 RepID=UPI00364E34EF